MKAFDPQWIAFRNFVKTGIQFAVCTKTTPWFLWPLNNIWTEYPTILVGSSPSERNRVCVEALLVVWSDLSERAREFDSHLWKSLWVTLIAIGFVLVFKAQLSGAKFNANALWRWHRRNDFQSYSRKPVFWLCCMRKGNNIFFWAREPSAVMCISPANAQWKNITLHQDSCCVKNSVNNLYQNDFKGEGGKRRLVQMSVGCKNVYGFREEGPFRALRPWARWLARLILKYN